MNKVKTLSFGKIDYYGCGRKINEVTVEIEIRDGYDVVSICGSVWNNLHTNIERAGQCLDDEVIRKNVKDRNLYETIIDIWKTCHLHKVESLDEKYKNDIMFILDERHNYSDIKNYFM